MKLRAAAKRLQRRAGGELDAAIVLGSGLGETVGERIEGMPIGYDRLGIPHRALDGHAAVAIAGTWAGRRVVAFSGRAHLYQGFDAGDVTHIVRLAAAAGARVLVLTNAAGGLNASFDRGDVMLIADQINLTGATPLDGIGPDPFLPVNDLYAPRLRALLRPRALARSQAGEAPLREGVYAGVRGPQFETPAECEALRRAGADVVGMSTVLEALAARAAGLETLGLSLVTNVAGAVDAASHGDVLAAARAGASRMTALIEELLAAL